MRKLERLQLRLDTIILAELRQLAEEDRRSMAGLISVLISREWESKHGQELPDQYNYVLLQ